jgi:galactonate dehydratase
MVRVGSVESCIVSLPRDAPYLGPLGPGEEVNAKGYFVRRANRTIYPSVDRSVIVRVEGADGTVGWGETYGIVAPQAVTAIIDDVLGPIVVGRDPSAATAIRDELYDLMRVRNQSGGYYGDAMAAVEIALWDLYGKLRGEPLWALLGGHEIERIPAYVSGLPRATLAERVTLAREWVAKGFTAIKYAAVVSREGIVEEMRALREALGRDVRLMVDLHWQFGADDAIRLIEELAPYDPLFAEAPCAPEDVDGLVRVARASRVPLAAGEEWRTLHEARPRLERGAIAYVQPEMARTGVSQFIAIGNLARECDVQVIPHATIGVGIFHAASLHAAAALRNVAMHEYQHSVFDANLRWLDTAMRCESGSYGLPAGPGIGVEPRAELWRHRV